MTGATRLRPAEDVGDDQPPQDQHAEQCVLGAMLLDHRAVVDVAEQLQPRAFYRPAHSDVFTAIVDLHGAGEAIDAVTVGHELRRRGALDRIGGATYLHTLMATVPTATNAAYYAEIVAEMAKRRRAGEALTRAQQLVRTADAEQLDEILDRVRDELTAAVDPGGAVATSWAPVDLTGVLAGTYRPPQPTVGARQDNVGLFYPGRVHSMSGESEAGKSWLALLACRTELERDRAVLYLDFEDDEGGVVGRLLDMGVSPDAVRRGFTYVRPAEAVNVGRNRAALTEVLDRLTPALVVLDGVTEAMTLHGLELIDNADVARFSAMLPRWIADRGPAVVSLDHVTKDREGRGRYSIGGQHKLAGLNGAAFTLENRVPFGVGVTGRSSVMIAKDRPAQLRRHAYPGRDGLHWFGDLIVESVVVDGRPILDVTLTAPQRLAEDEPAFRPTVLMRRISDAMDKAGQPLSQVGIEERVKGKATEVRRALHTLVDEKYVAVASGPRGSKLHTLTTPYRGDDE